MTDDTARATDVEMAARESFTNDWPIKEGSWKEALHALARPDEKFVADSWYRAGFKAGATWAEAQYNQQVSEFYDAGRAAGLEIAEARTVEQIAGLLNQRIAAIPTSEAAEALMWAVNAIERGDWKAVEP
jgi:hypothetical protein